MLTPVPSFRTEHVEWTEHIRWPRNAQDMTRLIDIARETTGETESCYVSSGFPREAWKLIVRFADANAAKLFHEKTMDTRTKSWLVYADLMDG